MLKLQLLGRKLMQILIHLFGMEELPAVRTLIPRPRIGHLVKHLLALQAKDNLAVDALVRIDRNAVAEDALEVGEYRLADELRLHFMDGQLNLGWLLSFHQAVPLVGTYLSVRLLGIAEADELVFPVVVHIRSGIAH